MKSVQLSQQSDIGKRKSPASMRMRGFVLGIVRRCFLETSLETERKCALAVGAGEHLFADFTESGNVVGECIFHTAAVVGTEANRVVNFFSCMIWRNFFVCIFRPAGECETEHGIYAEFIGDIEYVCTVGTEIPHGESVVLEVVVERTFESNVVGHEILTANIKAHAFNLRAVDQTYAEFFGALLCESRSTEAGNSGKEEKLFHLRIVEVMRRKVLWFQGIGWSPTPRCTIGLVQM